MASGRTLQANGHPSEAKEQFLAALTVASSFGAADARNFASQIALGLVTAAMGHYTDAEEWDNGAIRLGKDIYGEKSLELAIPLVNLAVLYRDQNEYAEAEEYCRHALGLFPEHVSGYSAAQSRVLGTLGGILYHRGKLSEAESSLQQSMSIATKLDPDSEILAGDLTNLAGVYVKTGRPAEALAALQEAYALYYKHGGSHDPNLVYVLLGMGEVNAKAGHYAEAVAAIESGIELAEAGGGANTIVIRDAFAAEASWLHKLKRDKQAKRAREKEKQIARTTARNSYTQYTVDAQQLGADSAIR